jgi:hypothetical protein
MQTRENYIVINFKSLKKVLFEKYLQILDQWPQHKNQSIIIDALPTPRGTQVLIPNWKQRKGKESKHVP